MIYTLTISPAIDYDIYVDKKLNVGDINTAVETNIRAGGKGINVSRLLNNLGVKSVALGFISGFTGDFIEDNLKKQGIQTDFIKLKKGITRINTNINDGSKETSINGNSPYISKDDINELIEKIKKLTKEDILVLAGSIPENLDKDIYYQISKNVPKGVKIVLDTRGEILDMNIYGNYLIKPNILELEKTFNKKFENYEQISKACKYFLDKGVENIIVSMGSKGALHINKKGYKYVNIPKGEYINSIGSGDSVVAGFIVSESLEFAVACGSASAYSYDLASKEKIMELYQEVKNENK
ncbi:1-phosphofructokinase family hexose kinase [Caviibacter abscessus]|uniref:1-phosphofructokinase family hexose kinase n=1 Tax=Caviibacter abscessus TaxID=1766719 RepID=UPI00082A4C2A|nr:1-phosphofructokinase family hexose kinase [Caviibacter abscessus]